MYSISWLCTTDPSWATTGVLVACRAFTDAYTAMPRKFNVRAVYWPRIYASHFISLRYAIQFTILATSLNRVLDVER